MEIKDIQKRTDIKSVTLSLRTTKLKSKFMKENNISPNALFDKALDEIMAKTKK